MTEASIQSSASFTFVRYASVWEDADVLCEALAPVAPGGRLLSIASAGDNALALLTLDPAEVVAADISPAQLACLELRIAAFRLLPDAELLPFLGVTPCPDRLRLYDRLRGALSLPAREFWDRGKAAVAAGIIHAGKFERYLRFFRRAVLPLIHPRWKIERLREAAVPETRERFYREHWDTLRWRLLFRLFVSRPVLGRLARDRAFFRHVKAPVAASLLKRTRHALTALPTHANPYLAYILTGTFPPEALPRYLQPEARERIRARLDRLRLVRAPIHLASAGPFDGFNLSDVFECMGGEEHERCYTRLLERAAPEARLVYWNLLAPRGCPEALRTRVRPLTDLAAALHARDRAWFYGALHVDEVCP